MKIVSYNVNGLRAAQKKGFIDWLAAAEPDVLCLQETKAQPEQIDEEPYRQMGYHLHWHSAQKKGYSGVALLSKVAPDYVEVGTGLDYMDKEGRVLRGDWGATSVMSVYVPSGTNPERQDFKMQFLADFREYVRALKKERPNLVIGGDFNICHKAIDIHNPQQNKNSSGFLPEERAWVDDFLEEGFVDSFREFCVEPHQYSWWSYRANARANNKGWRIDYNMVSRPLQEQLKRAQILPEAKHSDHCPVLVEVDGS